MKVKQCFSALALVCVTVSATVVEAIPITIGTLSGDRTSMPFDQAAFSQAISALGGLGDVNIVSYPTIPNEPLPVDLFFLTNAGMDLPLASTELMALRNFVIGGGTLLMSAFSDGSLQSMATANTLLRLVGATTSGQVDTGNGHYPTIPNAPAPFSGVDNFTNPGASEVKVSGNAATVIASGSFGPVLVYYPTIPNAPATGGQVIVYSGENAFADERVGGHFSANDALFVNIAQSAVAVTETPTWALLVLGIVALGLVRRLKSRVAAIPRAISSLQGG